MARNKEQGRKDKWQRTREAIAKERGVPKMRPKPVKRYNSLDQLKMIMAGSVEEYRKRMTAERGELIVTLNLCGAQFWHVDVIFPDARYPPEHGGGFLPGALEGMVTTTTRPVTVAELDKQPLYFTTLVESPRLRQGYSTTQKDHTVIWGFHGVIWPVTEWPMMRDMNQLVGGRFTTQQHGQWTPVCSRGKSWNYVDAQEAGTAHLTHGTGEGWKHE